jgi:hypothetical protein
MNADAFELNIVILAPLRRGLVLCAEYERKLGGGSPLSSLMAAKD